MWNSTDGVAVTTRKGEVDLTDTTIGTSQYRSTLRGSVLTLQLPNNPAVAREVYFYKAGSGAARYAVRVTRGYSAIAGVQDSVLMITTATAAPFFSSNFRYVGIGKPASNAAQIQMQHSAVVAAVQQYLDAKTIDGTFGTLGANFTSPYAFPDVYTMDVGNTGITPFGGNDWATFWFADKAQSYTAGAHVPAVTTYATVGLNINYVTATGDLAAQQASLISIDFFRKLPIFGAWV